MRIKSIFAKPLARRVQKRIYQWAMQPEKTQQKVFKKLISQAKNTVFGKAHGFSGLLTYADFQEAVPVRDYEGLKLYIDQWHRQLLVTLSNLDGRQTGKFFLGT